MKKLIVAITLSVMAAVAFALPSPKLIEDAITAHKYDDAKAMISQVLVEKPDSPRAHLLNAYLLIHVDKNKVAANNELQMAANLDKKGDVKNSPLFGRVVAEIDMQPTVKASPTHTVTKPVQVVKQMPVVQAYQPYEDHAVRNFIIFVLFIGGIILVVYLIVRATRPDTVVVGRYYTDGGTSASYGNSPDPVLPSPTGRRMYVESAPVIQPTVAPVMQSGPMGNGMGAFSTAASVAGGVVAGNMISDMLHHGHHHSHNSSYVDEEYERRRKREREAESYTPAPQPVYPNPEPSPVSYESERRSFSSSSSDDDSWGSSSRTSSYESSSSSSSSWDSGSSSSDSGSSSSSDW